MRDQDRHIDELRGDLVRLLSGKDTLDEGNRDWRHDMLPSLF